MTNHTNTHRIISLLLACNFIFPCGASLASEKKDQDQELNPLYVAGIDWYSEDLFSLPDSTGKIPKTETQDPEKENPFSLTNYYDQLDPPDQGGTFGRYSILAQDALYFLVPALTVMGVIYMLPEEVSNWEKDDINLQSAFDEWPDNVSSWVWDKDDDWINYIGHPYFGSTYYIYARHYGYSRLESFWFSFAISSTYEIAIEAWAEPVSIQDMIFTPLLGSMLGELLLPVEQHIKDNDNKVLGSTMLGSVSLAVIDPFGHIVPPLKRLTKRFFSDDAELQLTPTFSLLEQRTNGELSGGKDLRYGIKLSVQW